MADNLSQKSSKSNEKTKYSNAINRTTSETMRLGEPEKVVNHPTSLISSTPTQRKKTPSFQITSVTVGSRTSNDGGDDSADDLDESHTDDMSDVIDNSRITDIENETPSYSEDTFSKEDVFFNASTTSLGTAPVIPTSSQYGLAIVASESGSNIINAAVACANTISAGDVHVSVTDTGNVINIVGTVKPHETEMRDGHAHHTGRNERFKVVKIESTEPFKRGRWLCMDYLDHTMQQPSQQAVINVVRSNDSSDATTVGSVQYVGPPDSGVVLTDGPITSMDDQIITVDQSQLKSAAVSMQEQHQAMVAAQHQVNMVGLTTGQNTAGQTSFPSVSPGQTLQTVPIQATQQHVATQPHQGMQQAPPSVQQSMPQANIPQSLPQNIQIVNQQLQQSQQGNQQQNLQGLPQHAQSMSQVSLQQNMTTGTPQQPQTVAQHQSLPPQQIQQVMAAANLQMQQQQHIQQQLSQQPQQQIQQQMSQQPQQQIQQQMSQQPQQQIQQQMSQQPQQQIQQQLSQQPQQQQTYAPQQNTQQAQSQHITSQPGQSQGPYYNIPSSTVPQQVPISQGQSAIQLQPQTSISAQTQTIQTSTPSQPQVVTSVPLTNHLIQQTGVSQQLSQPSSQQQQQQHNIQLQQQQYAQQMQTQQQQQQQQQPTIQQIQQSQQAMTQASMQQPQAMSQQSISQQGMAQQTMPQQSIPQQSMPQQSIPQQGMPQQSIPQQGMPQQSIPQQGMPQQTIQQGMPQQSIQQGMPQQSIPQGMPQQSIPQQGMPQQSIPQQGMPQQSIPQQGMPQQTMQQPPIQQSVPQQGLSQQAMQQPQAMQQQAMSQQSMQQSQQSMPQQAMSQPLQQTQQSIPQQSLPQQSIPQQAMSQVMAQSQQAIPQVIQQSQQPIPQQQSMPQVMQQPQQPIPQQVMQQAQQNIQPQQSIPQTMQPQTVLQQPQTIQPQMHHSTNLQNMQPQQIHVGTVPSIAQQPQNIPPPTMGQGMMPGHQMAVTGGQQGPQMVPVSSQMPPVSSVVSSGAQSFSHIPLSQATTVSSRTVQSSISVGLDGTIDQTNASDASVALLESLVEVTANAEEIPPSGVAAGEDAESASGTSAVAIDNKIEQAMDLVKSHLMFAVREEVEVLKEKIAELMDRINQLELENTILKAHATQETLAQLGGSTTQQGNKNQQSQQPPNGSVS